MSLQVFGTLTCLHAQEVGHHRGAKPTVIVQLKHAARREMSKPNAPLIRAVKAEAWNAGTEELAVLIVTNVGQQVPGHPSRYGASNGKIALLW